VQVSYRPLFLIAAGLSVLAAIIVALQLSSKSPLLRITKYRLTIYRQAN
jgi:hypothetical protein